MSRITQDSSVDRFKDWAEASQFVSKFFEQVTKLFSNGITISDNFDAKILTLTFTSSATDTSLAHGLGRVPSGYLVLKRSANMVVYDGSNAWTSQNIYLRASAAGSITVAVL
jgi:hypothetical protein